MRIKTLSLQNVKSFLQLDLTFSKTVNLFVGPNNSGKSTILKSMLRWQRGDALNSSDVTVGQGDSLINLRLDDRSPDFDRFDQVEIRIDRNTIFGISTTSGSRYQLELIPSFEPKNLYYLFLSRRKVVQFNESVNSGAANSVGQDLSNLYAKIDRLNAPQDEGHAEYIESCKNIVGFELASVASTNGKQAAQIIKGLELIPLVAMGEGVQSLLGLIADLCVAERKIFLIEEPENDVHPVALKALLDLIIKKSSINQFFISTHSQIVVKYLGGVEGSKIFNVRKDKQDIQRRKLFLSSVSEVVGQEDRKRMLEELGYEFIDLDMWNAWLFLEESSAEFLIREYILKWFVPALYNKIRTFAAGGRDKVKQKFDDFNKLFVFLYLTPAYKNKAWVIIDGGEKEKNVIEALREKYSPSGWNHDNFSQFDQHDFERYYPDEFKEKVDTILAIGDSEKKRSAKADLLNEVIEWIKNNEGLAQEKFRVSARTVIEKLKLINP